MILNLLRIAIVSSSKWFIYSSANPQNFALTLKAGLPLLGFIGLGSLTADANSIIEQFVNAIALLGQAVTLAMTIYGAGRKLLISIRDFINAVRTKLNP